LRKKTSNKPDWVENITMKKLTGIITVILFGLGLSSGFAQDHSQHQAGATTDNMAHLDADLAEIQNTKDLKKRRAMLQHHLQMMRENLKALTAMDHGAMAGGMQGMDHGAMGGGGDGMQGMDHGAMGGAGGGMQGMDHGAMGGAGGGMQGMDHGAMGGMMQHHENMVKLLDHMLATQELLLGLIDNK
jgi:hypothetical protein